jgi:hypothetical protein
MHPAIVLKHKMLVKVQNGEYDKLHKDAKDTIMTDYLSILELHERVIEGKMTKELFFEYVDEIVCW